MIRHGRSLLRSKRTGLLLLTLLALGGMFLPQSCTGRLISLVQVILPLQDAATAGADAVAGGFTRDDSEGLADQEALQRQNARLEHHMASLQMRVTELEEENALLTATPLAQVDGWRVGTRGRLIPARVIAPDLLGWRESGLIGSGSLQGVRRNAAVISRFFWVDQGVEVGVADGMTILRGEVVIGLVDQVGPNASRVRLLSDVQIAMRVKIGRLTDDGFDPLDESFWLTGHGGGVMRIGDVDRRLVREAVVGVGDLVLSDPESGRVPVAMTIGRIVSIEPDLDKPLLSILTVRSDLEASELKRVWVFDPETERRESRTQE